MSEGLPAVPQPDGRRPPILPGTRLEADRSLEWCSETLVAGGAPWRLVRLTSQGAGLVARWLVGDPVSSAPEAGALARRLTDANLLHPLRAPRSPRAGEVAVVIPVRDDADALSTLLRRLDTSASVVIVVVDDGSEDASEVARVAARHGATLLRRDLPGGPAAARNAGLAATTEPFVCFLDTDVVPPDDLVARLLPYLDDPVVAIVAPRVCGPAGERLRDRFESTASPLDLGTRAAAAGPATHVPYVPSAAVLARRAAIGAGFDETLRTGEDVDLCWRLVSAGWQVRYVPGVVVTHRARGSWPAWVGQRVRYGTSAAALEARHGDAAAPLRADPRVLGTLLLALAGRPRAALSLLSWSGGSLARQLDGLGLQGGTVSAARRLALRGTVLAAPGLARSAFRTYGPVLVAAATVAKPLRRPVGTLAVAATATRWWRAGRPSPGFAFGAISVADDLSYGAGVLVGAVRARRLGALRPRLRTSVSVPAASRGRLRT